MSINVNTIIQNAFQRCSLVGDGQRASGTQAIAGLADLRSVISEFNQQDLISENQQYVDIVANDKIKFVIRPENWHEYKTIEERDADLENLFVGDVAKVGNEFWFVSPLNAQLRIFLSPTGFNDRMRDLWGDFNVKQLPDRVVAVARKLGNRYICLYPADKARLDVFTKQSLSTLYTCNTETKELNILDVEYHIPTFTIELNSTRSSEYRVTYLQEIPEIDIEDTLYYSSRYESALEDGLCCKLCIRYKLMDVLPIFEQEFEKSVALIKRTNEANRPMTYDFVGGGSYMDSYFNGLGGVGF